MEGGIVLECYGGQPLLFKVQRLKSQHSHYTHDQNMGRLGNSTSLVVRQTDRKEGNPTLHIQVI